MGAGPYGVARLAATIGNDKPMPKIKSVSQDNPKSRLGLYWRGECRNHQEKSAESFDPAAMLGEKLISVLPRSCELMTAP